MPLRTTSTPSTPIRFARQHANRFDFWLTPVRQVIQKIGLCICLYDILWTSEGLIGHGTGLVNVNGAQLTSSSLRLTIGN